MAERSTKPVLSREMIEQIADAQSPLLKPATDGQIERVIPTQYAEAKKANPIDAGAERQKALMQGYTGNSCGECGNFTMVRNGTCEKCDTCGARAGVVEARKKVIIKKGLNRPFFIIPEIRSRKANLQLSIFFLSATNFRPKALAKSCNSCVSSFIELSSQSGFSLSFIMPPWVS